MDAITKYAESERSKDGESDEDLVDDGRKRASAGRHNPQRGSSQNWNKRRLNPSNSDSNTNTNESSQRQKQGGNHQKLGQSS